MPRAKVTPQILAIANQLGVSTRSDPSPAIVERCLITVQRWIQDLGPVSSLGELLELVQAKLLLRFEVISSDAELSAVRNRFLAAGELGFVDLEREFNDQTDAVVLRLQNAKPWSNSRFVAVIDGRGAKWSRVWFSKWHEVAHLLAEPQMKFVFRRTQAFKREPVERLMDQIAAKLAFYEPLFTPALRTQHIDLDRPSLRSLQALHSRQCSFASLISTITAALQHVIVPTILIEAQMELKRAERERREGPQPMLLPSSADEPVPRLRAVTTSHNPAAVTERFFVHRNMRVPEQSIITRVFRGEQGSAFQRAPERLSWWESAGERLVDRAVVVEAMEAGSGRVLALVVSDER